MLNLKTPERLSTPFSFSGIKPLSLDSTLYDLSLDDFQLEVDHPAKEVIQAFDINPALPGLILIDQGNFVGMISRRRFLQQMSRPYALELFSKRPLSCLYDFVKTNLLTLPGHTLIVEAAKLSLQRDSELVYEPIVVEVEPEIYRLLDVHQLLVAQSKIHEITSNLLDEQTQTQLFQTEKLASLGRMMAGIAHEIRNPVNCIHGNSDFLVNYCSDLIELVQAYQAECPEKSDRIVDLEDSIEIDFLVEDLPKIVETVKLSSDRLTQIVSSLQNFSRMDGEKRQLVDLHTCLDGTLLILNNRLKRGITVTKNYGQLPTLEGYSGQLSQVFMNILSNAIDALNEKREQTENWQPEIRITTDVRGLDRIENVVIKIQDNGPGIPSEVQERIFENFFTTKPVGKGTGLGLAISHQIITQKHRGKIILRSQLNEGTEFEILLPLH